MSTAETTPAVVEMDLDAWLAGASRAARYVTLFADLDAYARYQQARARLESLPKETGERSLGDTSPRATFQAEADQAQADLLASAMEFRVEASIDDEVEAIRETVRTDLKDERAAVGKAKRAQATEDADILGIPAKDRPQAIRTIVGQAMDGFVELEVVHRALGDRVHVRKGGEWVPVGREALDRIQQRLGDQQITMLAQAWREATSERVDGVTPPFSPAP